MLPTTSKRSNDIYYHSKQGYYIRTPRIDGHEEHFLVNTDQSSLLSTRIVECSIEFLQIGEVDTMNERYQAIVQTKSKWYENESITEYNPKQHWNPKLFIENASHEKFQEDISYTVTNLSDKTMITEIRLSKGTFWERMELNDFPLDVQDLTVCVSTRHNQNTCRIVPDPNKFTIINNEKCSSINDQVIKSFRDQQKFKLYKLIKIAERASYDIDDQKVELNQRQTKPKFVAVCKCSRKSAFYLINAYLFNLLITVLSMTLFAIDSKFAQNRISGTFTLILTSFSFKVVTSKSLPTIAYLTSLDKYQLINIVYLALCCVWHSICASLDMEHDRKQRLDKLALYCFGTFFTSIQLIFLIFYVISFRKIRLLKKQVDDYISRIDPIVLEDNDN